MARAARRDAVAFEALHPPRVGLIALATDLTSERDAGRLLPDAGVVLHTTRVAFENPTTPASLRRMQPLLTDAARLLVPEIPLCAIWYSCTAASAILGDAAIEDAISAGRPGVPVVTPPAAAARGFRHLGLRRIAVLTPYLTQTTAGLAAYFEAGGFEIVSTLSLGIEDDRDMAQVTGASIRDAARAADHPEAEALFISCTALPALAEAARIEDALGKPVVTSNQASLWRIGHLGGANLAGKGRLFAGASRVAPA